MMIIFFRGAGFLAILLFLIILPFRKLIDVMYGENFYTENSWPKILGFCILGLATFIIGRYLNKRDLAKMELAQQPKGLRYLYKAPHSFMLLPLEFWGVIYFVAGFIFEFSK